MFNNECTLNVVCRKYVLILFQIEKMHSIVAFDIDYKHGV